MVQENSTISGRCCSSLRTDLSHIVYTTIPTSNVPSVYFILKFAKLLNVMKSSCPGQQWAPTAVAVVTNPCRWRACFLPRECQWQNSSVTSGGVVLNPRGDLHKNNWPELVNRHMSCFIFVPFSVRGNPFPDQPGGVPLWKLAEPCKTKHCSEAAFPMKQQQLLCSLAQNRAGLISYSSFERLCIKRLRFRILHPFNTWLSIGGMCSDINVTKKIYAWVKVISKKEALSLIIFGQELCPSSGDKSSSSSCDSSLSLRPEQLNWGNDQF